MAAHLQARPRSICGFRRALSRSNGWVASAPRPACVISYTATGGPKIWATAASRPWQTWPKAPSTSTGRGRRSGGSGGLLSIVTTKQQHTTRNPADQPPAPTQKGHRGRARDLRGGPPPTSDQREDIGPQVGRASAVRLCAGSGSPWRDVTTSCYQACRDRVFSALEDDRAPPQGVERVPMVR